MAGKGIYGLSGSGMDVDSIVKSMMKSSQIRLDKIKQQQTTLQWKKTEYNNVYSTLKSFQEDTVFPYKLQSKLMPKLANVDDSSIVSATANADAINFSHSLDVKNIAQGAIMTSSGNISNGPVTDFTNLQGQLGLDPSMTTISLTISDGTTTKTLSNDADGKYHIKSDMTIYNLVSDINKLGLNIKASYDSTLDRFFLTSTDSGAANQITLTSGDGTGTGAGSLTDKLKLGSASTLTTAGMVSSTAVVDGSSQPLKFTAAVKDLLGGSDTTLNLTISDGTTTKTLGGPGGYNTAGKQIWNLVNDINSMGLNVFATYDAVSGRFSISPLGTNGPVEISSTDSAGTGGDQLITNMHLPGSSSALPSNFTSGKNAVFTLDGVSLSQKNNNFTISGVNYNLKKAGPTNVTVASDIEQTVANVQAFIDSYNKMLAVLNGELEQKKYKDYLPLTDDQKKEMKDSEISAWEAKAKSGLLHNDTILQGAVNTIRNDIYSPIEGLTGKYTNAASIGITTGRYAYAEGGKLYVDETQLRKALQEDPEIVNKIFGNNASDLNASHASKGVTARLYDTLTNVRKELADQAGTAAQGSADTQSSLAKQLDSYKKRVTEQIRRMADLESRYYRQFNAMETALASLTRQSAWLSQQTSG